MDSVTDRNRKAWNAGRYEAWTGAFGSPSEEAQRLVADPRRKLRRLLPHLGDVEGRAVCNVQGSHGRVAVALALLGAKTTVIDFAEENRRYALELAAAAGTVIDYRLSDVMQAEALGLDRFDWLVMELGVVHYHRNLGAFFGVMAALAKPGGRFVLNEFHPVERKLRQRFGGAPRDYFTGDLIAAEAPAPAGAPPGAGTCAYRYWTLGEIVTAAIEGGWRIDRLEEHPDAADPAFPGSFTLLATRA